MSKKLCPCLFCWAPRTSVGEDAVYDIADRLTTRNVAGVAADTGRPRWFISIVSAKMGRPVAERDLGGRSRVHSADTRAKAKRMLDDGCSYMEVGRTLGMSHSTVAKWFPGRGFTKEQHAERSRLNLLELRLTGALRPERIAA